MLKLQAVTVKCYGPVFHFHLGIVLQIPDNRYTQRTELDPDLMRPSSLGIDLDKTLTIDHLCDLITQRTFLSIIFSLRSNKANIFLTVFGNIIHHPVFQFLRDAFCDSVVFFSDLIFLKKCIYPPEGFGGFTKKEDATDRPVQP